MSDSKKSLKSLMVRIKVALRLGKTKDARDDTMKGNIPSNGEKTTTMEDDVVENIPEASGNLSKDLALDRALEENLRELEDVDLMSLKSMVDQERPERAVAPNRKNRYVRPEGVPQNPEKPTDKDKDSARNIATTASPPKAGQ